MAVNLAPIYGLQGGNVLPGCPACQGVLASKQMARITNVQDYLQKCEESRGIIVGLRSGDMEQKLKSRLWALSPCGVQLQGEERVLANTLPRLIPKKGGSGEYVNCFIIDLDHVPAEDVEVCKAEILNLSSEGTVDILMANLSPNKGVHIVCSTDGPLFENCGTLSECQKAFMSLLPADLSQYLDTKVCQFTSLLFVSLPEDIWMISRRLFF